jgi:hypothetical protein
VAVVANQRKTELLPTTVVTSGRFFGQKNGSEALLRKSRIVVSGSRRDSILQGYSATEPILVVFVWEAKASSYRRPGEAPRMLLLLRAPDCSRNRPVLARIIHHSRDAALLSYERIVCAGFIREKVTSLRISSFYLNSRAETFHVADRRSH